jgi:serine/threonine protein kinase
MGEFFGAKFSSSVLPPEMFTTLGNPTMRKRFEDCFGTSGVWKKVEPRVYNDKAIVVKTLLTTARTIESTVGMKVKVGEGEGDERIWDEGEVVAVVDNNMIRVRFVDDDGSTQEIDWNSPDIKWSSIADSRLPYTPVIASPGIDLWALGVMLFYCHSDGSPLLSVNRDDDLSSPADYHQAATWTKEEMNGKILALNTEPVAKDLLMKLLRPDPDERIQTMSELLNHAYFTGADADADTLKNIVAKMLKDMEAKIDEINATTKRIESNTIQLGDISVKTFELLRETRRVSKSFNIFLIS